MSTTACLSRFSHQLAGRYELHHRIGCGAMGDVYLATDLERRRKVSVRLIWNENQRIDFTQLWRPALILARHPHEHLAAVLDCDCDGDVQFLVCEYVDGMTLRDLTYYRSFSCAECLRIIVQIVAAVKHAHQYGLVHGNLSSLNIRIANGGAPKILDLGHPAVPLLGPVLNEERSVDQLRHQFCAPECLRGAAPDKLSDIYSIGVIFYSMLMGRMPFPQVGPALFDAVFNDEPLPLFTCRPEIPNSVSYVLLRCMEKSPALRYQSCAELEQDLTTAQNCSPAPASTLRQWRMRFGRR